MGKNLSQRYKVGQEVKLTHTHGKKKNAIANAVTQVGKGLISVNKIPIQNIEPKYLRIKIFEPIL
jgi:small subunit ribosomal protein S9